MMSPILLGSLFRDRTFFKPHVDNNQATDTLYKNISNVFFSVQFFKFIFFIFTEQKRIVIGREVQECKKLESRINAC